MTGREVALERVGATDGLPSERMTGTVGTEPLRVKGGFEQ